MPHIDTYPQASRGKMTQHLENLAVKGLSPLQPCCYRTSCLAFVREPESYAVSWNRNQSLAFELDAPA
jgi:hypothetical protein